MSHVIRVLRETAKRKKSFDFESLPRKVGRQGRKSDVEAQNGRN
jgi:hypothetical protein